ncbi:MAG TPA: 5'-nucleotidase C-terminal domain-containing protein, partial [Thermoanaerobaculia bacterium]
ALAGSDFERLLRPETQPAPETRFLDRATVAKDLVRKLREEEKVHAVVLIGHAHLDEDIALAKEVAGIDLIFGTHSHIKRELGKIEGTETWLISPYQYLTYVSRVELLFRDGRLSDVGGGLVPIVRSMPEGKVLRRTVKTMQRELERDPKYRDLFVPIGRASEELGLEDQLTTETLLGNFVMDVVRGAAKADLALSTTSSFRQPIAPGVIRFEDLRATLPYPNRVLLYEMKGSDVRRLLELSVAKRGSDSFSQLSGARIRIAGEKLAAIEIGGVPLDDEKAYRLATTDYQAKVAGGYKEIFATLTPTDTGLEVRDEVRKAIEKRSPISAKRDGRIVVE